MALRFLFAFFGAVYEFGVGNEEINDSHNWSHKHSRIASMQCVSCFKIKHLSCTTTMLAQSKPNRHGTLYANKRNKSA